MTRMLFHRTISIRHTDRRNTAGVARYALSDLPAGEVSPAPSELCDIA